MSRFGIVSDIVEAGIGSIGCVTCRVRSIVLIVDVVRVDWRVFIVEHFHRILVPDNVHILEQNINSQKTDQLDADDLQKCSECEQR